MTTFLRRLELHGFKSFASKTVLEFPSHVVSIVGPNGSGKSNIIDALRWVLGEREAKQLRGLTLENLIFAGTPKKPSMGFAHVTLYFDNRDGLFPIDAKEIALSRRVDRSGTSQFLLNDEEIRLKDLLTLLARARLGARGLTMIGQGQSTLFVESSPDERRTMIEEVLGLKEFRIKKHIAERRLLSSGLNMEKVRAMIDELTPHLNFLRRQRKRWEKRSEIESKLRGLEDHYYSNRLYTLLKVKSTIDVPEISFDKEVETKKKEIIRLEEKIESIKEKGLDFDEAKKVRGEISLKSSRRADIERELARVEVEIEFKSNLSSEEIDTKKSIEALKFSKEKLELSLKEEDISSVRRIINEVLSKIRPIFKTSGENSDIHELKSKGDKLSLEKEKINSEIKELELRADGIAELQEKASGEFRSQIEKLEDVKSEVRRIEQKIQSHFFEREKINLKLEEIEREWLTLGREKDELHKLKVYDDTPEEDADRKMLRLRAQLLEVGSIDEDILREAEESEERYTFLSKEMKDIESAISDLKKLIKDLDEKIHQDFEKAFTKINEEFHKYFSLMFGGGKAKLKILSVKAQAPIEDENNVKETDMLVDETNEIKKKTGGIGIEVNIPKKKISNLEMLSGGEKSLVSLAALFALISVSPPPFLVLDEIDAALDDVNSRRFADLVREFSSKTQFIIVTHNRATMETADALYGVTMADDGVSKLLSMKLENNLTKEAK